MAAKKRSRWCGVSIFFQGFSRENENRSSPKMWQFEKVLPWTQGSKKKLWEFFVTPQNEELQVLKLVINSWFVTYTLVFKLPDSSWYHLIPHVRYTNNLHFSPPHPRAALTWKKHHPNENGPPSHLNRAPGKNPEQLSMFFFFGLGWVISTLTYPKKSTKSNLKSKLTPKNPTPVTQLDQGANHQDFV